MKRAREKILLFPLLLAASAGASDLNVDFISQFDGAPVAFDAIKYQTAAGQKISVTRLDFLASDIALRRDDGTWIGQTNWFAYIGTREGKTSFVLPGIPAAGYDRVRFHIGLEPSVNRRDAAQWPAKHPLNPDVNHLYWGWSREYVFLALEGGWLNGGELGGFLSDRLLPTSHFLLQQLTSFRLEMPLDLLILFINCRAPFVALGQSRAKFHQADVQFWARLPGFTGELVRPPGQGPPAEVAAGRQLLDLACKLCFFLPQFFDFCVHFLTRSPA